jgi:hypothetical protein
MKGGIEGVERAMIPLAIGLDIEFFGSFGSCARFFLNALSSETQIKEILALTKWQMSCQEQFRPADPNEKQLE